MNSEAKHSEVRIEEISACDIEFVPDAKRSFRFTNLAANIVPGGHSFTALLDQVMISAANFATNLILVRALGLTEYGKYSIAYTLLLYANALQMSFVSSPMLTIAPGLQTAERRTFVNGMLSLQLLASLLVFVVFGAAGTVSLIFTSFYPLRCIVVFALCIGTFQLQDWLRRYYFIYHKGGMAIVCDFISYVVQLCVIVVLWQRNILDLFSTFGVMCITSGAAFLLCIVFDPLRPELSHLKEAWRRSQVLSRGLVIANQVRWFGFQGVFLFGSAIVGVAAAGGIRATLSLAGPMNLVLTSFENIIPLRIAEELKKRGAVGAFNFTRRSIITSFICMLVVIAPTIIFGKWLLGILYGPAMVVFYIPMVLQLATLGVQVIASLWVYLYRGLHDMRVLLRANIAMTIASLITIYPFAHYLGASGVVLASLCGFVTSSAYFALHWKRTGKLASARYQPSCET